jgi:hypothetical protein
MRCAPYTDLFTGWPTGPHVLPAPFGAGPVDGYEPERRAFLHRAVYVASTIAKHDE